MLTFDKFPGLLEFKLLKQFPEVLNFVTTRHHPNGKGNDFNIGFSGGSLQQSLLCRRELSLALDIPENRFVFQNQIHGKNHCIVDENMAGAGFLSKDTAIKDCDILITNTRNICIVTRSADCIPVLLYSPDSKSIAAVHSGREGTFLGATMQAARLLHQNFGAKFQEMIACIGPGINGDCYEVDMDCASKFLNDERFNSNNTIIIRGDKAFLDLKKMIFYDLLTLGLVANNIEISDICTKCCRDDFFSARRGENQRFCAGICLR